MSKDIQQSLNELKKYLISLKNKLIAPHLAEVIPDDPDACSIDLKSYVILCHAAFEDYVEQLGTTLSHVVKKKFTDELLISYSSLCLLNYYHPISIQSYCKKSKSQDKESKTSTTDDDDEQIHVADISLYQYIMDSIISSVQLYSKDINNNHGASEKYLIKILYPLGVAIPSNNIQSINTLADYRGQYAHTINGGYKAKTMKSPEELHSLVESSYELMKDITEKAINIVYFPPYSKLVISHYNPINKVGFDIYSKD